MNRSAASGSRQLTLTEELEKLEQSITLTLQEIDQNFSKAHRIVTTSILPLVEQYGEHSRGVWEATKFWKQFFEASANVSLSGYEELANDEAGEEATVTAAEDDEGDTANRTAQDETTASYDGATPRGAGPRHGGADASIASSAAEDQKEESSMLYKPQDSRAGGRDESMLTDHDGDLTGSTPRGQPPSRRTDKPMARPQFADLDSPYETVKKREMLAAKRGKARGGAGGDDNDDDDDNDELAYDEEDSELAFQQQHTARLPDMSMTGRGSGYGYEDEDEDQITAVLNKTGKQDKNKDPLIHRVLDKNYRLMATPHKGTGGGGFLGTLQAAKGGATGKGLSPGKWRVTTVGDKAKGKATTAVPAWEEQSPMSSPEMAVPQLRSAAFMSPLRAAYRGGGSAANNSKAFVAERREGRLRTAGVSVQTPTTGLRKTRDVFASGGGGDGQRQQRQDPDEITWDSDSEEGFALGGMSPPKTIQFALPPSKLMQTPAREASKRIVDDILLTAGAGLDESADSPSMVKMDANFLDDTF